MVGSVREKQRRVAYANGRCWTNVGSGMQRYGWRRDDCMYEHHQRWNHRLHIPYRRCSQQSPNNFALVDFCEALKITKWLA